MVSKELDVDMFSPTECHLFYCKRNYKHIKKENTVQVLPFCGCKSQLTQKILSWHLFTPSFLGVIKEM